jgi:CRISPR-associated protein Cmr5
MSINTRSQKLAHKAYECVETRKKNGKGFDEYETVARKFPALIHTCGLAQAVAFAQAKSNEEKDGGGPEARYLEDLAAVLTAGGHQEVMNAKTLGHCTREVSVITYLRLSRDAIDAAVWLKRYAECLAESQTSASSEIQK